MEGLSVAANGDTPFTILLSSLIKSILGLAVVSVAFQLTEACIKIYRFWESVEDAPREVAAIKEDLQYLISVFKRIESNKNSVGDCIVEGIQHCRIKVLVHRPFSLDRHCLLTA